MKKIFLTLFIALCAQMAIAGDSYYFQRAEEAYQKKDLDLCLHYCKEGVAKDPKDGKCWAVIAEIYSKREYARYGEAMQAAEKALATLPKKDKVWVSFVHGIRGDVFYKVDNMQASKEAYMLSLSLQPESTTFLYDLADVCYRLGEYDEAITYFKRYIALSPSSVFIYGEMAYVYYKAGNKEEAQRCSDLANALASGRNCMAHRVLSRLAMDKADYIEACREAARAMFCGSTWYEEGDTLNSVCPELLMAAIRTEVAKAQKAAETNATAAYCTFTMQRYWEALYYLHRKMEQSDAPQSVYPSWLPYMSGWRHTKRQRNITLWRSRPIRQSISGGGWHKQPVAKANSSKPTNISAKHCRSHLPKARYTTSSPATCARQA